MIPIVPTARRDFSRTDRVTALLRVYQGGRNALAAMAVRTSMLDASGTAVFQSARTLEPPAFGLARAADHTVDLPMTRLRTGPHLLTIEATAGGRAERRHVVFLVR